MSRECVLRPGARRSPARADLRRCRACRLGRRICRGCTTSGSQCSLVRRRSRAGHSSVHQELATTPLTTAAFDRWVVLFQMTVDDLFTGTMADYAKNSAVRIAATMENNITSSVAPPGVSYRRRSPAACRPRLPRPAGRPQTLPLSTTNPLSDDAGGTIFRVTRTGQVPLVHGVARSSTRWMVTRSVPRRSNASGFESSEPVTPSAYNAPGLFSRSSNGITSLLSGGGLHDLSATRKGNTIVPALSEHHGFNQGLIDVCRPIPTNQEIGPGPTHYVGPLDHELD